MSDEKLDPNAPQYRVTARSFINNGLVEEGAVVAYSGKPGANLEPLNTAALAAKAEAGDTRIDVEDLTRQKVAAIGGNPEDFELAHAASVAGQAAEAALNGKPVTVDNTVIQPVPTPEPVKPAGAGDLV